MTVVALVCEHVHTEECPQGLKEHVRGLDLKTCGNHPSHNPGCFVELKRCSSCDRATFEEHLLFSSRADDYFCHASLREYAEEIGYGDHLTFEDCDGPCPR